jgi:cell division protein FtsB
MARHLFFILFFLLSFSVSGASEFDEDYYFAKLDSLLDSQEELTTQKQMRINAIRSGLLVKGLSQAEEFMINRHLYQEYIAFKYDSAYKYVNRNIEIARKMKDVRKYNVSIMEIVHIFSVAGLFDQAKDSMSRVIPSQLSGDDLIRYYSQYSDLCLFNSEYTIGTPFSERAIALAQTYRKKVIDEGGENSFEQVMAEASYVAGQGEAQRGLDLLFNYLNKNSKSGEREYSIITSTIAFLYGTLGDKANQKKYLLLCAISDVRGCIRENNSLRELASLLFDEGDYDHAYNYLQASIEDAGFYGSRLRNLQASQLIPKIVKGYQHQRVKNRNRMNVFMIFLSILVALLVAALIFTRYYLLRYREANGKVREMNEQLHDAVDKLKRSNGMLEENSKIKEEYIGRFMELASIFIDKADDQRKAAYRLVRENNFAELHNYLKDPIFREQSSKKFYENFDVAFLNIYPDFVDKVNELLRPDARIEPKGERLSTELRILALIRLGIADNQRIADILRSSITTIYTYRSKLKGRSLYKDEFETRVASIGSHTA